MENNHKALDENGNQIFNTDHPLHPGDVLKMEMKARGLKKKEVGIYLGMYPNEVTELCNGKRDITIGIAEKLERLLGIKVSFFIQVQEDYKMMKLKQIAKKIV